VSPPSPSSDPPVFRTPIDEFVSGRRRMTLEGINGWVSESFDICFASITKATIESRHKWLTIGGEKEGHCGVSVVHGGIPQGGACPLVGGTPDSGYQYSWPEGGGGVLKPWPVWTAGDNNSQYPTWGGGGQYLARGGSGGHIGGHPTAGDPTHDIVGVGPIRTLWRESFLTHE
jgi:hypothetical protein